MKLKYLCKSFSTGLTLENLLNAGLYRVYGASGHVGYLDTFACDRPYLGIIKDGAGIGRVVYCEAYTSLLGTMAYIVPNSEVDMKWLKYTLMSLRLDESVEKTTIPHIYFSDYGNREVYWVAQEKQQRIAAYLDAECNDVDIVISKTRSSIDEYKLLKQSVIVQAVTKGLTGNRKKKDSGIEWIGAIPEEWKVGKIGQLYDERRMKVSDSEYKPLSVTKQGVLLQLSTAAKTNAHDERKLVRKGDFAINSRSDRRGSCGIASLDGSVSLINTVLIPRGEMVPQYYDWLFHTAIFADEFYKWGHGIVDDLWTTGWSDMKNISVLIPSTKEQSEIAEYLNIKCSEIDALILKKEQLLSEIDSYKKSLIYEYVTGKREVPQQWQSM